MKHSEKITNFICELEGFRSQAYQPIPNDKWTIGYGSTYIKGNPVKEGDTISNEDAKDNLDMMLSDLDSRLNKNRLSTSITQNQYDAVISLCYNIGITNFNNSSTGKLFYAGLSISDKFDKWSMSQGKKIQGLVNRRMKERNIYDNNVYE